MSAVVFGKLPAHGDFIARGLAAAERVVLDAWLSASLSDARDRYGAAFDERFDAALPWHCAGPGVAGAIAASQDGAGRRYPVLLLCDGVTTNAAGCEDLLYAAVGEGWSADRLSETAGTGPTGLVARWYGIGGERVAEHPVDLIGAMLA